MTYYDLLISGKPLSIFISIKMDGQKAAILIGKTIILSRSMYRLIYDREATADFRLLVTKNIPVKIWGASSFVPVGSLYESALKRSHCAEVVCLK